MISIDLAGVQRKISTLANRLYKSYMSLSISTGLFFFLYTFLLLSFYLMGKDIHGLDYHAVNELIYTRQQEIGTHIVKYFSRPKTTLS